MEKKAQLTGEQLQEVDAYLGKLVHSQDGADDVQVCPTCHQVIVKEGGAVHRMLVITGKSTGVYLPVPEGKVLTVGRGKTCDVQLEDPAASRQHAEIRGQAELCLIRDLDSANGTQVNGAPVRSKQLSDGDVVVIGSTRIIFYMQRD